MTGLNILATPRGSGCEGFCAETENTGASPYLMSGEGSGLLELMSMIAELDAANEEGLTQDRHDEARRCSAQSKRMRGSRI